MTETFIMGQSIQDMLVIQDQTHNGRLSFWIMIGILAMSYTLYSIALLIWTQLKIKKLEGYKLKLDEMKVAKNQPVKLTTNQTTPQNIKGRMVRKSLRDDPEVQKAMENLRYFQH